MVCFGSDGIEPLILVGSGGTTISDVIDIISDVILVIYPAPHPRYVAVGTCQCSY